MKKWIRNKRYMMIVVMGMVSILFLGGCTLNANRNPYPRWQVQNMIKETCDEKFKIVSATTIQEDPRKIVYQCETKDRGISFTGEAYWYHVTIDATETAFYESGFDCDYIEKIFAPMEESVKATLLANHTYNKEEGWFEVTSYEDIKSVAVTAAALDEIYQEELQYHKEGFGEKNPLETLHVAYYPDHSAVEEHRDWVNVGQIQITGKKSEKEWLDKLATQYAQLVVDGEIHDDTIPAAYTNNLKISTLEHIYLDGEEMLYDVNDRDYTIYGVTTNDYMNVWYNYDVDSYMMICDVAYTSDNMSCPYVIHEYVDKLGGTYAIQDTEEDGRNKHTQAAWNVNDHQWKVKASLDDEGVTSFDVYRDNKKIDMEYYTYDQDINIRASFVVGLKVEDFAKLLDLDYTVEGKNLYFTQKN